MATTTVGGLTFRRALGIGHFAFAHTGGGKQVKVLYDLYSVSDAVTVFVCHEWMPIDVVGRFRTVEEAVATLGLTDRPQVSR